MEKKQKGFCTKISLLNLKWPAIAGLLGTLPFILMELVNRRDFNESFPLPLFGILLLLPILFIATIMPVACSTDSATLRLAEIVSRVVLSILLAWLWLAILQDQTPCFLGAPNCD